MKILLYFKVYGVSVTVFCAFWDTVVLHCGIALRYCTVVLHSDSQTGQHNQKVVTIPIIVHSSSHNG